MVFSWCFGKNKKDEDQVEPFGGEENGAGSTDPVEAWTSGPSAPANEQHEAGQRRASGVTGNMTGDVELESIADEYMVESISRAASRENSKQGVVRDWYEEERFSTGGSGTSVHAHINWKKGELLGVGAFGKVYLGLNLDSGELMAVKAVPIALDEDDEQTTALVREISLMKVLFHENIVRYIGTQRDETMLHIFLEYVPGGSIAAVLQKFGSLSEAAVRAYTKQILQGLAYLHAHQIMHRDVKGANILVSNNGTIKLADFGASKKITEMLTQYDCKSLKGTPYWMAPEVIMQAGHGRSADIWSIGATVVEMLTGKPPYSEFPTQVSVLFHIASTQEPPTLPPNISDDTQSFLTLCFQRNPKNRPTAKALLEHPFITNSKDSAPVTPVHVSTESPPKFPGSPAHVNLPPSRDLPSAVLTPPVALPNPESRTLSHNPGAPAEPTGAGQISTYLNDMLAENQQHLSGDFRQSLKLLMTKDKGRSKRRVDVSGLGASGDLGAALSSGGTNNEARNSSAPHEAVTSPGRNIEDEPIVSSYTRQVQREQDLVQAKVDEAAAAKMAKHRAWQDELHQAAKDTTRGA